MDKYGNKTGWCQRGTPNKKVADFEGRVIYLVLILPTWVM